MNKINKKFLGNMNKDLLQKHIQAYHTRLSNDKENFQTDLKERKELVNIYQEYNPQKIDAMDEEDLYKYISPLWAMLIWGNKRYVVDKLIEDNGMDLIKQELKLLLWSEADIEVRWDKFRKVIKGMGPAMISEILCKTHPDKYIIWNRRALMGLNYLGVKNLPRYDYQLDGKKYSYLCSVEQEIAVELKNVGFEDNSMLMVDYFIWDELQVEETLSESSNKLEKKDKSLEKDTSNFIHNDIRDKIRNIGQWLGFEANIRTKSSCWFKSRYFVGIYNR